MRNMPTAERNISHRVPQPSRATGRRSRKVGAHCSPHDRRMLSCANPERHDSHHRWGTHDDARAPKDLVESLRRVLGEGLLSTDGKMQSGYIRQGTTSLGRGCQRKRGGRGRKWEITRAEDLFTHKADNPFLDSQSLAHRALRFPSIYSALCNVE